MSGPDWNAASYHRVSDPQFQWGLQVLRELDLEGDETVLDAGCGTGRLTSVLLERLPEGRVIALDTSQAMLDEARRTLERFGDRVVYMQADLGALGLEPVADVVFSTATFHWVPDEAALFQGLFRALKPGGRLHAQCGGAGNLSRFLGMVAGLRSRQPFAPYLSGFTSPTRFAAPDSSEAALRAAGFEAPRAWLHPALTPFATPEGFLEFVSTVVLRHGFGLLPQALHEPFRAAVLEGAQAMTPPLALDYVRLELRALRA